ncbi:acyl-CoA reductase [Paenibacillus vini]|uniref:acyl-CoA reductase n=1 Tax=Paenibacillus vini TaxID=1476024 RepID=UPI0025B644CE|nr:acyl-CoA reductase [Paenibacillus vini]MDN4066461.1 acyl-CoA reductase [Paenibacillus vini]
MVIRYHSCTGSIVKELSLEQFTAKLTDIAEQARPIRNLSIDEMIQALYGVYQAWAMPSHPMYHKYKNAGLAYLLAFLHPESIKKLLTRGLRSEFVLDRISEAGGFKGIAVPKGIVGHWVAGNVPLLSLISVLQAVLTKNVSIVKLSSKQEDWISPFLHSLAGTGEAGRVMAEAVSVFSFPGEWEEPNAAMAAHCDVRIAWGGQEAVRSVAGLKGKDESNTLIFGPKYSCSVIDPLLMSEQDWISLARDTVLFQQLACSSPHAVIVKGRANEVREIASQLENAFNKITHLPYYEPLEAGESVKLLEYRAAALINGEKIKSSRGTEWTIHTHERLQPLSGQGMRIIHVYPCDHWNELVKYLPSSIQTISHRLDAYSFDALVHASKYSGVSRFVSVGNAHTYDIPWDGMLVLDQLVRWIRVDG